MTPAPELPTEAERIRNRAHGQITRSRAIQLRKVEGTGTTCTCDDD